MKCKQNRNLFWSRTTAKKKWHSVKKCTSPVDIYCRYIAGKAIFLSVILKCLIEVFLSNFLLFFKYRKKKHIFYVCLLIFSHSKMKQFQLLFFVLFGEHESWFFILFYYFRWKRWERKNNRGRKTFFLFLTLNSKFRYWLTWCGWWSWWDFWRFLVIVNFAEGKVLSTAIKNWGLCGIMKLSSCDMIWG